MKRGRERALLQASRRLSAALGRAGRLGAPLGALESVALLAGACGARGPLSGRALALCLVSVLVGALGLALACGRYTEYIPCRSNSSKELHIQTMSWDRLPEVGSPAEPEGSSTAADLRDYEETPQQTHQLRLRGR